MKLTKTATGYIFETSDIVAIIDGKSCKTTPYSGLLGVIINVVGIYGEPMYFNDIAGLIVKLEKLVQELDD